MKSVKFILALVPMLLLAGADAKDKDDKNDRSKSDKAEKKEHKESSKKSSREEPAPGGPPAQGYDAFRYVKGRNIFDPNRRGMRTETSANPQPSSISSRGRSLALTGTMVTEGKSLAFFGGSAAEGNRVVAIGNNVANYKVAAIAATQVSLEREGKTLLLDVGRQLSFDSSSGDTVISGPIVEMPPPTSGESPGGPGMPGAPSTSSMAPPPGVPGDKAEILRRMMERRAKEVGK